MVKNERGNGKAEMKRKRKGEGEIEGQPVNEKGTLEEGKIGVREEGRIWHQNGRDKVERRERERGKVKHRVDEEQMRWGRGREWRNICSGEGKRVREVGKGNERGRNTRKQGKRNGGGKCDGGKG